MRLLGYKQRKKEIKRKEERKRKKGRNCWAMFLGKLYKPF